MFLQILIFFFHRLYKNLECLLPSMSQISVCYFNVMTSVYFTSPFNTVGNEFSFCIWMTSVYLFIFFFNFLFLLLFFLMYCSFGRTRETVEPFLQLHYLTSPKRDEEGNIYFNLFKHNYF